MKTYLHNGRFIREDKLIEIEPPKVGDSFRFTEKYGSWEKGEVIKITKITGLQYTVIGDGGEWTRLFDIRLVVSGVLELIEDGKSQILEDLAPDYIKPENLEQALDRLLAEERVTELENLRNKNKELRKHNEELQKNIENLTRWRREAFAVEASWDVQAVGEAIGLQAGDKIHQAILPWIIEAKAAIQIQKVGLSVIEIFKAVFEDGRDKK